MTNDERAALAELLEATKRLPDDASDGAESDD